MSENEYPSFPKIPRLSKQITVTEKIDGTNALIAVDHEGLIRAGSRNRWLTKWGKPTDAGIPYEDAAIGLDNMGFGRWVCANAGELVKLGPGTHYGEWYGQGIQCTYGLKEKRLALFNWTTKKHEVACVEYVPMLYCGEFNGQAIEEALHELRRNGSKAVPGYMHPEGVVVRFSVNGIVYKAFCEEDV